MKRSIVVASIVASSSAFAQAPGQVAPVVAPAPPPFYRWSVGGGLGVLQLAPHDSPEFKTTFPVAMLAVRFRPWRSLELEVAFNGGGVAGDLSERERKVTALVLGLRYRFNPNQPFNGWLMLGAGGLTIESNYFSDGDRELARKGTLQAGAGVEYRWSRFALQAELRAVAVERDDSLNPLYPGIMRDTTLSPDGWAGAQLTVSANYYVF